MAVKLKTDKKTSYRTRTKASDKNASQAKTRTSDKRTSQTKKPAKKRGVLNVEGDYAKHIDRVYERNRLVVSVGQDIRNIPKCLDPRRRFEAYQSLQIHLEQYHAHIFTCPWATYHLELIHLIELAVFDGGWFIAAVPRGGGKSSIAESAVEWAILHGHKRWPVLIGATSDKAEKRLKSLKTELRNNDRLQADFPDACYPIRSLGRSARRCEGQTCNGTPTAMDWGQSQIALPTLHPAEHARWAEDSKFVKLGLAVPKTTFGSRITALGLTGDIRGLSEKTEDMQAIRPDFAIPDDPQTRESSRSFIQSQSRAATVTGDVAYLNGPGEKMSVVMPATVIYQGDMVDQLLDRDIYPEWRGVRHRMVINFPKREDLWDRYAEIRRECLRTNQTLMACNDFYSANREAMDDGAEVSWQHRHAEDELSAIQHAMNLKIRDEESFWAEAQNQPRTRVEQERILATPLEIMVKQNHCPRGIAPQWVQKVAAHIDVQQRLLYYTVAGGSPQFEVAILDYGTAPEQKRTYFSYKEDLHDIQQAFIAEQRLESQLYMCIQGLIFLLASKEFQREDGVTLKVEKILIDSGWMPETVIKACKESPYAGIVIPTKGIAIEATSTPMALRASKSGEKKGHEWLVKPKPGMLSTLHVQMNSNYWKTQVHIGFKTATGPGAVSLWHERAERHRMFADQVGAAEFPTRVKAKDNEVDEWQEKPNHPDNHFFDTTYGALVGLSMLGCALPGAHETDHVERRQRRRYTIVDGRFVSR